MRLSRPNRCLTIIIFLFIFSAGFGQSVPLGIAYQAVTRDNFGKEIINKPIEVKLSIIIGNTLGDVVYQELHKVTTSKYGMFNIIIGSGDPNPAAGTYGELSQINWSHAPHYLKVEVKFDNDFIYMGTNQFLAVPYALYAQTSLEPGPTGPKGDPGLKGDPGDPASDDQILSFDQANLTISGGNSIPLTSLLQNLTITASPEGNYLGISRGNSVLISTIEADGDPENELQDLTISSDKLKITDNPLATEWDLTKYLDNTDNQALLWDPETNVLSISGGVGGIDLSELKDDADADPANELQSLTFDQSDNTLYISDRNSVSLGEMVAFRAKKIVSTPAESMTYTTFVPGTTEYNDGNAFNELAGEFVAPVTGIYCFNVSYFASGSGGSRKLSIYYKSILYEDIAIEIPAGSFIPNRSVTMKVDSGEIVKLVIYTGISTETGTGSFSGFKVN